jgi:pilus assembly protein CpaC
MIRNFESLVMASCSLLAMLSVAAHADDQVDDGQPLLHVADTTAPSSAPGGDLLGPMAPAPRADASVRDALQVALSGDGPVPLVQSNGSGTIKSVRARRAAADVPASNTITVEVGTGRIFNLTGAASSVFVAEPKIAEARPASPTSVFIFGVNVGQTTVAAVDQGGRQVGLYKVVVQPSSFAGNQASAAIAEAVPDQQITVKSLMNGMELTGKAQTAGDAERAVATARSITATKPAVDDRTSVPPTQVLLRVRIAEMSRTVTRDLGLNWQNLSLNIGSAAQIGLATALPLADVTGLTAPVQGSVNFPKGHVEAILDALAENQLVHVLAEPNLTALSGESASFLVGGEFPIPVSQQSGQITITFKQYGISLAFVPTVINEGRISLHVRPEVSQLTDQGSVQLSSTNSSIVVPGLQIRRADTTIELGSGQSFAIAGLLSDSTTQTDNEVPFLGSLPGLGALFRADSFKRQQSELVILVTPFIVRPVSNPDALQVPTAGKPPNDLERILLMRQTTRDPKGSEARITGDAGFIIQ